MSDYIKRAKALYGLDNIDWYHVNDNGQLLPGGKSDIETYVPFKAVEEMLKSIHAADVVPGRDFRDCRNELCLQCGQYRQRHLGACDGCRWREI